MNIATWFRRLGPEYHAIALPLRRAFHGGVARVLEARWPNAAWGAPAQQQSAPDFDPASLADWLCKGQRAAQRSAHALAIAMFCKALDVIDSAPADQDRVAERAQALAGLGQALFVTKGPAAPEVEQACGMARTLCRHVPPSPELFPTVRGLWEHYHTRGEVEAASELAEQCQRLAAGAQDPVLVTEADFRLGVSFLFAGHLAEAREHLQRSVVGSDVRRRRERTPNALRDPRVIALVHLAHATWLCGYPDQAMRVSEEAVASARAAKHPSTLTHALLGASWLAQLGRDMPAARAAAAEAMAGTTREGCPADMAMARIIRDAVSTDAQPADGLVTAVGTALDGYRATGRGIALPYLLGLLADLHGAQLETEPALEVLDQAAEIAGATGECWYEPEIRRREGELLLRQSITNQRIASARFCQAIAVAQQQGSKILELRATVSLARLWSDAGRRCQARDMLAPICGWFREGFETADLEDARALLGELQ